MVSLAARRSLDRCLRQLTPLPTTRSSRTSMASISNSPISISPPPKSARGSPTITQADRKRVLLQYVIENELMAEAAEKDGLDKAANFPDRAEYHQRRALRDAFFDMSITRRGDGRRRQEDLRREDRQREARAGNSCPAHPGADRGGGQGGRRASSKNGEDFATRRQGEVQGYQRRRRRSRLFHSRPDAEAVRGCGVRARCRPDLRRRCRRNSAGTSSRSRRSATRSCRPSTRSRTAIKAQLVQAKAQEVVTGLRDAAKIEVRRPRDQEGDGRRRGPGRCGS